MSTMHLKKHGAPNWAACATTNLSAAEDFYHAVFGWEPERFTSSTGTAYSIQRLGDLKVASLYEMNAGNRNEDVPPHWETYFEVDDVDEVLEKVAESNGKVIEEPFVEPGTGTIAVIQDNTGAYFMIWHSKPQQGCETSDIAGAMAWNELCTKEPAKAAAFYKKVFDLESVLMQGPNPYTILKADEREIAGILQATPEMGDIPSCWDVYFSSDDIDASVKAATAAGGKVLREPFDIPGVGARMAVLQDPQGAVFEIIKGEG